MTKNKQILYISPDMKAIETKFEQIICQSGGINDMTRNFDQDLDW